MRYSISCDIVLVEFLNYIDELSHAFSVDKKLLEAFPAIDALVQLLGGRAFTLEGDTNTSVDSETEVVRHPFLYL